MSLAAQTPVVVIGDDWGRHVSTLQHLFRHVARRHPLIWVNSFGHRAPQLTVYDLRRALAKITAMVRVSKGVATSSVPRDVIEPRALPWHNLAVVRSLNTWSLARDIRRSLSRVAPGCRPILVTGTPVVPRIVGTIGEVASVYFCMDEYGELPGVSGNIIRPLEQELLSRVDMVVATATALVESKRPASGLSFRLPQGVNFNLFATRTPLPADLAALPRPRIGFAGGISAACDLALLAAVSDANPSGSIILVGPVHIDLSALRASNFHILGNRPYDMLPAYVQGFDVGIIPYVDNEWTRSVDPLKLLEYLAAGIPVVTTALPEAEKYAEVITIASDVSSFIAGVAGALQDDGNERKALRQKVAAENTWEARAQRFLEIIDEVMTMKRAEPTSRG